MSLSVSVRIFLLFIISNLVNSSETLNEFDLPLSLANISLENFKFTNFELIDMKSSGLSDKFDATENLKFLESNGEDFLSKSIQSLSNVWGSVLKIFHSSRSSEIKEKLIQNGFSKFYQSSQVQILYNVIPEGLGRFFDLVEKRINVPEQKRNVVKYILEESTYADSNIWACSDIAFSKEDGAGVKFASIFSNRGENGKYTFVIIEIQTEFELAQDILVIEEKLSIVGGIWSESKIKLESTAKSLTQEDVKTIFSFFQIITYKRLAEQFGIKLDF
jgi:hypothetical protein